MPIDGAPARGSETAKVVIVKVLEEMAKAEQRLAADPSLSVADYYRIIVVEQGNTSFP